MNMLHIGQEVICIDEDSDFEGFDGTIVDIDANWYWVKFYRRSCPIPYSRELVLEALELTKDRKTEWE